MKKIITLLMLTFIVSISFAQYTPMTAAGYQFKRILCDSTLHIPSFCGIPTLRNSSAKNGAIAMDTCNYRFYMWTNIGGWSQIVGAGTDTTSLSNRIDQRVKYTDTAAMLMAYLRKQDTANRFVANVTKVNDSTIRVFKGNTITDLKILGKGTDTTSLSNRIDLRVKYTDTAAMLLPYLRKVDTTAMLSKYLRKTDTASLSNRINLKVNISDTATMLSNYLRKTDTTNRFVNAVTKVNDSTIRVWKGATSTTIELPRGSGGGSGSVTNVGTGYGLSGGPITSTGTIIVDSAVLSTKYLRRADTSNLVATKSNVAIKLNITDTTNKFVNNVTKINDTAIRIWKGTTSTVISLAKDIVYTQSPIMSKISNDSNIIYFNADTANAWRGGGGIGTVTSVATGYGLSGGTITNTGTLIADTSVSGLSGKYVRITDTATMLLPYLFGSGTANYVPKFINGRKLSYSSIADSSSKIYFTTQNLAFDYILGYPRMISGQSIQISSQANSGDKVIIGTIGGNTTATSNEVVNELGDVSATTGTKINTLIRGRLLHSSGTQEVDFLKIQPNFQQTGSPSTITRGIYYNPTFTQPYNGKNIAFQSTSGDIVLNNLKTSSSTTDSIAIFVNDTLKKAPYPSGGGGLFVPYTGATADVDLGTRILSTQSLRVTGTNGAGDIHLRHQASDATATGQSTSLFADANGDLKYKNAGNFYTTLKTSSNAANAIYTFPSATTTLIGAADTSVFQRKSISLYSFMANNTNATGNATAQTFRDTAGTYAGTITWTGTAPTTQTINTYQWQQIGKMVRLQLFGYYTNAGSAITSVTFTIPSDCPAPDISMFTSGALAVLYQGIGGLGLSSTSLTTTTNAYMRRNAANNGNELLISAASANYRRYQIDITYRAQ